jgi:holo-ACP synthase/triphosphoribosyl-dephospho-CoA synthase
MKHTAMTAFTAFPDLCRQVMLQDVLEAREQRARIQAELRSLYGASVVSITINMPGRLKYTEDTVSLVYEALQHMRISARSMGLSVFEERVCHSSAGPAAFMAIQGDAYQLKNVAVQKECETDYGRLLDIDVFDSEGCQINRAVLGLPERTCIVCSEPAIDCMRAKRHTPAETAGAVQTIILSYRTAHTAVWAWQIERIGSLALEAMLLEAACAPAPGLVDRFNSGAHRDMDLLLFMKSSSALAPAMHQCALAAWNHDGRSEEILPVLREIGKKAEQAMFQATGGVNTQKGLLFLLGIIVAATAKTVRRGWGNNFSDAVLQEAACICSGIVDRELGILRRQQPVRRLTAGEQLYLDSGVTGVRGEIEAGLPVVSQKGLPALRDAMAKGLSLNDALVHTLLCLMTATEDTTILYRHNASVLKSVQMDAEDIIARGGMYTERGKRRIKKLDQEYSKRNISPGGSADLLAVTYFLYETEKQLSNDIS